MHTKEEREGGARRRCTKMPGPEQERPVRVQWWVGGKPAEYSFVEKKKLKVISLPLPRDILHLNPHSQKLALFRILVYAVILDSGLAGDVLGEPCCYIFLRKKEKKRRRNKEKKKEKKKKDCAGHLQESKSIALYLCLTDGFVWFR